MCMLSQETFLSSTKYPITLGRSGFQRCLRKNPCSPLTQQNQNKSLRWSVLKLSIWSNFLSTFKKDCANKAKPESLCLHKNLYMGAHSSDSCLSPNPAEVPRQSTFGCWQACPGGLGAGLTEWGPQYPWGWAQPAASAFVFLCPHSGHSKQGLGR